jgi:hypothetical protein
MIYDVLVGRYLRLCMSILGCSIARRYIPNGTWVTGRTRDCGLLLHFDHMQTIWLQRLATDSNTITFTSRRVLVLSTCRTHREDCFCAARSCQCLFPGEPLFWFSRVPASCNASPFAIGRFGQSPPPRHNDCGHLRSRRYFSNLVSTIVGTPKLVEVQI